MREAVALLAEKKIGALPVVRGGEVAGIMSERDIIYCLKSDGAAVLDWPVERIMTSPAITVEPDKEVLRRAVDDDPAANPPSAGGRGRRARWGSSRSAIWSNTGWTGSRPTPRRC